MATYVVGDVQGCFGALTRLLDHIDFQPGRDDLWLLGDLVARGPRSLDVLRFVRNHPSAVRCILGNHDLALLAYADQLGQPRPDDLLDELLAAPDCAQLCDMMRRAPLAACEGDFLLLHAGALPSWGKADVLARANEASAALQSPDRSHILRRFLYGPEAPQGGVKAAVPSAAAAAAALTTTDATPHVSTTLRVLTCLRTLDSTGSMDGRYKGPLATLPVDLTPWFRAPNRALARTNVACGHWAALGLHIEPPTYALDGGYVWGGQLCAMRLDNCATFAVAAPKASDAPNQGRAGRW